MSEQPGLFGPIPPDRDAIAALKKEWLSSVGAQTKGQRDGGTK